jgi:hypothetical protein
MPKMQTQKHILYLLVKFSFKLIHSMLYCVKPISIVNLYEYK